MNACEGVRPRLGMLLAGALEDAEQEEVLTHLELCEGCGGELAELHRLSEVLSEAPPQRATASPVPAPTEANPIRWKSSLPPPLRISICRGATMWKSTNGFSGPAISHLASATPPRRRKFSAGGPKPRCPAS